MSKKRKKQINKTAVSKQRISEKSLYKSKFYKALRKLAPYIITFFVGVASTALYTEIQECLKEKPGEPYLRISRQLGTTYELSPDQFFLQIENIGDGTAEFLSIQMFANNGSFIKSVSLLESSTIELEYNPGGGTYSNIIAQNIVPRSIGRIVVNVQDAGVDFRNIKLDIYTDSDYQLIWPPISIEIGEEHNT